MPSLLSAVASGGGTRQKATCSCILVASNSSQRSRTHQSEPGVSCTIRNDGAMQIVFFCQHSMTEVNKYMVYFPFFRSETEDLGSLLHLPIFFLPWQKFLMEVLKSATTPNCATWTLFSGMTSLIRASSLSRCLNLQATCLLVSMNLQKCYALPRFIEKNKHPIFHAVGFKSTNSCVQGHQALFRGRSFSSPLA